MSNSKTNSLLVDYRLELTDEGNLVSTIGSHNTKEFIEYMNKNLPTYTNTHTLAAAMTHMQEYLTEAQEKFEEYLKKV